jgi:hypothetical protein
MTTRNDQQPSDVREQPHGVWIDLGDNKTLVAFCEYDSRGMPMVSLNVWRGPSPRYTLAKRVELDTAASYALLAWLASRLKPSGV